MHTLIKAMHFTRCFFFFFFKRFCICPHNFMLSLQKHIILIHHYDTENSKTTSSVYRVFTFKTVCAHTHTDAHMPASQCHMHHPLHSNTHTPPASVHTHNVFLSPVAHRGLGKWSGMEEISTLIALLFTLEKHKASGICLHTGGEMFHLD